MRLYSANNHHPLILAGTAPRLVVVFHLIPLSTGSDRLRHPGSPIPSDNETLLPHTPSSRPVGACHSLHLLIASREEIDDHLLLGLLAIDGEGPHHLATV